MKTPHKHAKLIKAWADGAEIEYLNTTDDKWEPIFKGWSWDSTLYMDMRIKPEPDVVEHTSIYRNLIRRYEMDRRMGEHFEYSYVGDVQLTWDGTTGKLKSVEVL